MAVEIIENERLREVILSGVRKFSETVLPTLGPLGRNCAFDQKYDVGRVTNSGAVTAALVELEEKSEQAAVEIIRQAGKKTCEQAGDGTCLTVAMAWEMVQEGNRYITAGANPMLLKKGMKKAADLAVRQIEDAIEPMQDLSVLQTVATLAANQDEQIGRTVAQAFEKVGLQGIVEVEDSQLQQTLLEHSDGVRFEKGYLSPYFATDPARGLCELEKPHILVANIKLETVAQLQKMLEQSKRKNEPLLIIAREIHKDLLPVLALNAAKKVLRVAAVEGPGHGETRQRHMQAIAAMTGAAMIDQNMGIDLGRCGLEICGRADAVRITKEETLIRGPEAARSDAAEKMRAMVESLLEQTTEDYAVENLRTTMSLLRNGIAVIKVGGRSELEMFEKKDLYESAVAAAYAAVSGGVVAGGGSVLIQAAHQVQALCERLSGDEKLGARILYKALYAPTRRIAENAGFDGSSVIAHLAAENRPGFGFDVRNGQFCDMKQKGILDTAKAVCGAVQNAQSAAQILLTAGAGVF